MNCVPASFTLAEILVLAGTAGASGMAPPTSTRISARLKRVQEHNLRVNINCNDPPRSLDVDAKLHVPGSAAHSRAPATLRVVAKGGEVLSVDIVPAARRADIVILPMV